ncbi:Alpha/Beta hydrolase protein [Panaeolus papilionaceus]|nr:Alpha/Beta hydrolase protein [Panaeolus papilionaceus]
MFSSFQPEINIPPQNDPPPPPSMPPRRPRSDSDKRSRKPPPQDDPWELHKYKAFIKPIEPDPIHQLLLHPTLFDPVRTPRYPIVLCHGLYGFDSRGPSSFPSMRMHYWSNVLRVLRGRVGAEVIVTSVPGTGSIASRASKLDEQLQVRARGRGINFLAHSMGGLDCRHLISHIRPAEYAPLSLTSICTPHRGSPFMDWCSSNIGIGKLREQEKELTEELRRSHQRSNGSNAKSESSAFSLSLSSLPSSFTTLLLSIVDSPAYANLRSDYLNNVFNPATPDDSRVKYWSVASRVSREQVGIWHPFWLPKMVLDGVEEAEREKRRREWVKRTGRLNIADKDRWVGEETPMWANEREWGNDGLVTVQSAKWGEFLGIMEGCDHWEMRGARGIEFGVDLPAIPAIGLGTSTATAGGDGWGFGDWTRFVNVWKTTKKEEGDRAGSVHKRHQHDKDSSTSTSPQRTAKEKEADDLLRASTEKLSAVFDWLIDIVPSTPSLVNSSSSSDKGKQKELGDRADLERFYVALARKMYDAGL